MLRRRSRGAADVVEPSEDHIRYSAGRRRYKVNKNTQERDPNTGADVVRPMKVQLIQERPSQTDIQKKAHVSIRQLNGQHQHISKLMHIRISAATKIYTHNHL